MAEVDEEELREAFNLYEKNQQIKVKDDLPAIMRILGHNPSNDEMAQLERDNPSGQLDFNAFRGIITQSMKSGFTEEEIRMSFRIFDTNNSGKIAADQLRHVLLNLGDTLTPEECDALVAEAGGGKDIDYSRLAKIMTAK